MLNEQMARLEAFKDEPAPPDMATSKRLAEYWSGDISDELRKATDEVKAKFAEFFDLHAIYVLTAHSSVITLIWPQYSSRNRRL